MIDNYCRWLSHYFFVPGLDPDDLYQEATLAAWLAPHCPRIAARRRILDLLKWSQRRPKTVLLDERIGQAPDALMDARETLRRVISANLTEHERIALGRSIRGEPIRREEKALGVAYWRVRKRLLADLAEV